MSVVTSLRGRKKVTRERGSIQLYCQKKKSIKTIGLLKNGHTDIVRTISYNKGHFLLTGGEDGQICTWKITL
ncbi:hypothetical protein TNCV_737462 [Trichonephila clavipes]|nr:hypothetical protein TNCV_737462 [Trichonephila clavipes]